MIVILETLIAAVRSLGADVCDVSVAILPSGSASIHVRTNTSAALYPLAVMLGCSTPEVATDGRSQWLWAERGEYGDPIALTVTGGHCPVCQCHPKGGMR